MCYIKEFDPNNRVSERIFEFLEESYKTLLPSKNCSPSLYSGRTGELLFSFSFAKYFSKSDDIVELLNNYRLIEYLSLRSSDLSYSTGLSGFLFLKNKLINIGILSEDSNQSSLNSNIFDATIEKLENGQFDLMTGAIGYLNSILNRSSIQRNERIIVKIVSCFEKCSIKTRDGYAWLSDQNSTGLPTINISLSHGSTGIILIIIKILELTNSNSVKESCLSLISKAVTFVYRQRNLSSKSLSVFPYHFKDSKNLFNNQSRLAWCYGDLGIGYMFLKAGIACHNQQWYDFGKSVLHKACSREDYDSNRIFDSGFCHGTSGICHIFNKAFSLTSELEFKKKAMYWSEETTNILTKGVVEYLVNEKGAVPKEIFKNYELDENLLTGKSGISLVLSTMLFPNFPEWDDCFLL